MQITLEDNEIKHAISEYIKSQGIVTKNRHVEVEISTSFAEGRGSPRVYKAQITIGDVLKMDKAAPAASAPELDDPEEPAVTGAMFS